MLPGVLNVQDYGAKGDGHHRDTTAVQDAINDATTGEVVYFPPGTYLVSGVTSNRDGATLVGTGRTSSLIAGSDGDVLSLDGSRCRIENLGIHSRPGAGHVVTVPTGKTLAQSIFRNVELVQANSHKNIFRYVSQKPASGGGVFDVQWEDCSFEHVLNAGTPGFFVYSDNANVFSANRFSSVRVHGSRVPFFDIQLTGESTYHYNNVWSSVNFERCNGGGIRILSGMNTGIHDVGFFDNNIVEHDLIWLGHAQGTNPTTGTVISNYHRSRGILKGAVDIRIANHAVGGSTTLIGVCGPAAANVTIDVGARSVDFTSVIGFDSQTASLLNAQRNGVTINGAPSVLEAPSIYQTERSGRLAAQGDFEHRGERVGLYGVTPVPRAVSPRRATGQDADVINGLVQALRDLGIFE